MGRDGPSSIGPWRARSRSIQLRSHPDASAGNGRTRMPTLIATLALAAVMTLGDFAWAAFNIRHSVVKGVIHGAAMCLCLGLAIGLRAGKPRPAAIAGPLIGVAAASTFYLLAPALRWGAMFPAWMLLWMLFALLQRQLATGETIGAALKRGVLAALMSGLAFYLISDI